MKKILLFVLLCVCGFAYGQTPAGYTKINARYKWTAGIMDSGLHVPQYNGVPSGTRTGVWAGDGAIAVDTTNHYFYIFSGGAWVKIAKFSDIGAVPISSLTAAAGANTIDNTNYKQQWDWSTLAGNIGLSLGSTSTAANGNTQKLLSVELSGANANPTQTTYSGYFRNTHTGTDATNIGVYGEGSSGTINYGGYFSGTEKGVFGISGAGRGVEGSSTSGNGVYGNSSAGTAGVYGTSSGATTYGVYAVNSASTGDGIALRADATNAGTSNTAGYFSATSGTVNNAINIAAGALTLNSSAGTSGQVLTSAGANTLPTWSTPSTVATAVPINGITAATGTNTISNTSYGQAWNWNSLANSFGLALESSNTGSSGSTQVLFQAVNQGANSNSGQTTKTAIFQNAHSGTTSTNIAGYFTASGGTNNYAIIIPSGEGSVGIGTSTPTSIVHVVPIQTTGIGAEFISSTTTSGTILDITGTSTALAANNEGLNIAISGANGTNAITATGARISVTNTNGTSGTNVGLDVTASGATTANNAIRATGNVLVEGTGNYIMGRWRARVDSTTSSATPTINTDNVDVFKITALAAAVSTFSSNLSGAPMDGDILELIVTDNGTARALSFGSSFVATTVALPTTTTLGVTLTMIFQYYKSSSYGNNKWHIVNYY